MTRKTLYQLCASYSRGMIAQNEYHEAREALIADILSGKEPLQERVYPTPPNSDHPPAVDSATEIRRMAAKVQAQQLQELQEEQSLSSHSEPSGRLKPAVILVLTGLGLAIAAGGLWYLITHS